MVTWSTIYPKPHFHLTSGVILIFWNMFKNNNVHLPTLLSTFLILGILKVKGSKPFPHITHRTYFHHALWSNLFNEKERSVDVNVRASQPLIKLPIIQGTLIATPVSLLLAPARTASSTSPNMRDELRVTFIVLARIVRKCVRDRVDLRYSN